MDMQIPYASAKNQFDNKALSGKLDDSRLSLFDFQYVEKWLLPIRNSLATEKPEKITDTGAFVYQHVLVGAYLTAEMA
jgi:hypothetical protein